MAEFFKKLVRSMSVSGSFARGPRVVVGGFGKHPAWNDHIDPDIGLDGTLLDVKRRLYLEGIRDNAIASWLKALPAQLVPFGHVMLWKKAGSVVAGRLWHSRDGRGRDDFPMVVCADCSGVPMARVVSEALPVLERLEAEIKAATTPVQPGGTSRCGYLAAALSPTVG